MTSDKDDQHPQSTKAFLYTREPLNAAKRDGAVCGWDDEDIVPYGGQEPLKTAIMIPRRSRGIFIDG